MWVQYGYVYSWSCSSLKILLISPFFFFPGGTGKGKSFCCIMFAAMKWAEFSLPTSAEKNWGNAPSIATSAVLPFLRLSAAFSVFSTDPLLQTLPRISAS